MPCCGQGSVEDLIHKFKAYNSNQMMSKAHPHTKLTTPQVIDSSIKLTIPQVITKLTIPHIQVFKSEFSKNGFMRPNKK